MQIQTSGLNDQQTDAIRHLISFVSDPETRFITVQGFAGTGKTYMIQRFLQGLLKAYPKMRVAVSAPTNSAVAVLKEFGSAIDLWLPSATIHSLLGLVLSNDGEERSVKRKSKGDFDQYHLVLVDECSMLNRQVIRELVTRTHRRMKVIFMGDIYQLNPVNEDVSESFTLGRQLVLSKVMRQEEGHLLSLIADVRQQCIDGSRPARVITALDESEDGVHLVNEMEFKNLLMAQFDTQEFKENPNFCRALAWTNREVLRLNKMVRIHLFGLTAPQFLPNEPVTVLNPVYDYEENLMFATNEQCMISAVKEDIFTDYLDNRERRYKIWNITLESMDGKTSYPVMAIHKDSEKLYKRRLAELAESARNRTIPWLRFWQFKEMFCDVRHIYANTVHRAQGQTIENVFVNVRDLRQNDDKDELRRLFYVATSRASKNLVVNHDNLVA
ncbi:TPA: AAA family ATPase [Vibrio parahaemolyticus]|nr:AAA family ATPase [Vibrio parahaemolyticus]